MSLSSLAIGLVAIWSFWHATVASAGSGVLLYAVASVVDHSDGEIARLTFQESRLGANLDWTIDTIIHAGLVLGIGVIRGGGSCPSSGSRAPLGVTLSAVFARYLPREIEVGPTVGGVAQEHGQPRPLLPRAARLRTLRWLAPRCACRRGARGGGLAVYWLALPHAHPDGRGGRGASRWFRVRSLVLTGLARWWATWSAQIGLAAIWSSFGTLGWRLPLVLAFPYALAATRGHARLAAAAAASRAALP